MVASCPVCDAPVDESADHCSKCGFPTVLWGRLDGPLPAPAEPDDTFPSEPPPSPGGSVLRESPETEVNASLARALEERTDLLLTIDRDAPDVTGELCEAALSEAAGRVGDAQQVLRSAQGRLDRETEELLARHLENLEARGRQLEASGLRLAMEAELGNLAETIVAGDAISSVAALREAERRLEGVETHWRGLQGLIAQVTTLRQEAAELGIPLDRVPDRLDSVRSKLATMAVTDRDLDGAAQAAAESLMQLHEAIPPALELELARHAETIEAHRDKRSKARAARLQHVEAVRHLSNGRLEEAVRSVRELRTTLAELAREVEAAPPPPPRTAPTSAVAAPTPAPDLSAPPRTAPAAEASPPKPPVPPPTPGVERPSAVPPAAPPAPAPGAEPGGTPDAAFVATLMKKARTLAVQVRSLPADSPAAALAAREIHAATDLLRTGRYAEADASLSRIMRTLAEPRSGS